MNFVLREIEMTSPGHAGNQRPVNVRRTELSFFFRDLWDGYETMESAHNAFLFHEYSRDTKTEHGENNEKTWSVWD